jgi:hypothetical protein
LWLVRRGKGGLFEAIEVWGFWILFD